MVGCNKEFNLKPVSNIQAPQQALSCLGFRQITARHQSTIINIKLLILNTLSIV